MRKEIRCIFRRSKKSVCASKGRRVRRPLANVNLLFQPEDVTFLELFGSWMFNSGLGMPAAYLQ
jgi:hypothetical protein